MQLQLTSHYKFNF